MSIYNCTISELQHFVIQPLLLPILKAVNLHVLILKIENVGFSQIRSHLVFFPTDHYKYDLGVDIQLPDKDTQKKIGNFFHQAMDNLLHGSDQEDHD